MPLNYSIVLLGNPRKPDDPKKAYARSQVSKELTLKGLSQRVAAQTTVSRADVSAVLISVVENMIEALRGCVKSKNQVFFDILYKKDFISLLC